MVTPETSARRAVIWRQRASRLRDLALTSRQEKERLDLLTLARQWEAMALLAETLAEAPRLEETLLPPAGRPVPKNR